MVAYAIAPNPKLITPVSTLPRISQRRHGTFMSNLLSECKVLAHRPTPDERCGYTTAAAGGAVHGVCVHVGAGDRVVEPAAAALVDAGGRLAEHGDGDGRG